MCTRDFDCTCISSNDFVYAPGVLGAESLSRQVRMLAKPTYETTGKSPSLS